MIDLTHHRPTYFHGEDGEYDARVFRRVSWDDDVAAEVRRRGVDDEAMKGLMVDLTFWCPVDNAHIVVVVSEHGSEAWVLNQVVHDEE